MIEDADCSSVKEDIYPASETLSSETLSSETLLKKYKRCVVVVFNRDVGIKYHFYILIIKIQYIFN